MMKLNTLPVCAGEAGVFVHWSVGLKKHGIVEVNIPMDEEDRLAIAEAIAIRTLLHDKQIFARKLITGHGTAVALASKDILRFCSGYEVSESLALHCQYLTYETPDLELEHNQLPASDPLFGEPQNWIIYQVDWRDRRFKLCGELWETALGPIYITHHVIEQFAARMLEVENQVLPIPKRSLLRHLKPGIQMRKLELSAKEQAHKLETYGPDDTSEIWATPHNRLSFTIIRRPEDGTATLVSCYRYKACQKM